MTYPALRTFPSSTNTAFEDLMKIRTGEHFVRGGYEYRATENAYTLIRDGYEIVTVPGMRRNSTMPSGWELANFSTYRACLDEGDLV